MRRRPRSGGFQPPTVETISVETTDLVKSQTSGLGRKFGVNGKIPFRQTRIEIRATLLGSIIPQKK